MAETVSWDGLRELAEFRAEKGCAISLYLDLDPKTTPTAGDATDDVPGRHDQGGWSQARFQRHTEKLVAEHLKEVAEELDRRVRRMRSPQVIVVSSEEVRAEFEELVSSETKNAIVGWTSAD